MDWSPGLGAEQTGLRPALIIQNDSGNQAGSYPNTIVATISTKGRDIPFHVSLRPTKINGLEVLSYVKCEQILTVSKARLIGPSWGRLTEEEMSQVDEAIKRSLGLE